MYDLIIIGAGVIGSVIAQRFAKYDMNVAILEKENDVANEVSMANSAIIHSGHDPKDGTLKMKLNVRGNALYETLSKEMNFEFQRCGAFVAAKNEEEQQVLTQMAQKCEERKIPVTRLPYEAAKQLEPHLAPEIIEVLSLPTTGIVYPWEVAIACMEHAMDYGAKLLLNHEVLAISHDEHFTITTNQGVFESTYVINCGGLYGDQLARMIDPTFAMTITPRIGEYFVIDHEAVPVVSRVIYPTPSQKGKGILVVPTVSKNVLLGPTAQDVDSFSTKTSASGLQEVKEKVGKHVKDLPFHKIIRSFAGVRPKPSTQDFVIEPLAKYPNFINVIGIESPGLASAPAIAEYVEGLLPVFPKKANYHAYRRPFINLKKLTIEQRNELIAANPRFGRIVCRCEEISEGEIIDCMLRHGGGTTIKGIKKRVRPGMGRCQGGFCEPLVVALLSEVQNKQATEILYDGLDTNVLLKEI